MRIKLDMLEQMDYGRRDMLEYIAGVRNDLSLLSDFQVTSYGPSGPNDQIGG